MAEAAPGFEAVAWFGMFVPRGTPPAVVKRIRDDIADVLKDPDVSKRMHDIGGEPSGMPTEEFAEVRPRRRSRSGTRSRRRPASSRSNEHPTPAS